MVYKFFLSAIVLTNTLVISAQIPDSIPTHFSFTIESKHLNETRTINVWTPSNYDQSTDSLPVLYMPDGGVQEDFPHVANTLADLIQAKRIPPVILVGIENTQRRRDLTGPTEIDSDKKIAPEVGGSEKFRSFITGELFSEINTRYRTTSERGIIGESLAGLFIVECFLLTPTMFDFYLAMDPSLWWNDHYLVRTAKTHLAKFPADQKYLWFTSSKTKDISRYTKAFAKILAEENIPNLKWSYTYEPKEKHNTIYRATKVKALEWFFNER
jgi:predicted alpha/beta superfamily hydrolase